MALAIQVLPNGHAVLEQSSEAHAFAMLGSVEERISAAFVPGVAHGFLQLATRELQTALPVSLAFAREFAQRFLARLCHIPDLETANEIPKITIEEEDLVEILEQAPPMRGSEYLSTDALLRWWKDLEALVREEIAKSKQSAGAYLRHLNPLWRLVGRVTFHLAENKRDPEHPFAFLATYSNQLSKQGTVQHLPLSRALHDYAGAKNRQALIVLLTPIHEAAEKSPWVKELVDSGSIYEAQAWTPRQAYAFLQNIAVMDASGIIVRVPDWWKSARPPRPQVNVQIGENAKSKLGVDALLDFSVSMCLGDETITSEEMQQLLAGSSGLVQLRGKWVEVDKAKLSEALAHWRNIEQSAKSGEISFAEGMRLLAGAHIDKTASGNGSSETHEWVGVRAGKWLTKTLEELRDPSHMGPASPEGLVAELRPYQEIGVNWLRFMTRLGLGACLADDMGLGKTIQLICLLLHMRNAANKTGEALEPSLLIVPASLIANWKSELTRFAPSLKAWIAHPSDADEELTDDKKLDAALKGQDLAITTYGMLVRLESLRNRKWNLVVLDEAQAIKNSGTRQTQAVKQLHCNGRIVLTGTPVENRLSDLWSLFDFLNPGLLGNAKAFGRYVKSLEREEGASFAPLRTLVKPYILRRLKTDKKIIADLPEKTEVKAFCGLSKHQAVLYEQAVRELGAMLKSSDGIKRRGVVLAYLMRFKQICNHPSHFNGDGVYDPAASGKFHRLAELCEELSSRQERVLVFTQFRQIAQPLADYLAEVFGRPGLVLHGGTSIPRRREMVEAFQQENGPPFFVLSIKAGGTGLNLTAASQVIHFDRWWNPAVENQATDRAFRIGQKKNVLVHKFVCRGTVEERIDQMISDKIGLSNEILDGAAEKMLTEMSDRELLNFVALDIGKTSEE